MNYLEREEMVKDIFSNHIFPMIEVLQKKYDIQIAIGCLTTLPGEIFDINIIASENPV